MKTIAEALYDHMLTCARAHWRSTIN